MQKLRRRAASIRPGCVQGLRRRACLWRRALYRHGRRAVRKVAAPPQKQFPTGRVRVRMRVRQSAETEVDAEETARGSQPLARPQRAILPLPPPPPPQPPQSRVEPNTR